MTFCPKKVIYVYRKAIWTLFVTFILAFILVEVTTFVCFMIGSTKGWYMEN